jgi:hypothetical protein
MQRGSHVAVIDDVMARTHFPNEARSARPSSWPT